MKRQLFLMQGNTYAPHSQGITEFHTTKTTGFVGKIELGGPLDTCMVEQNIFLNVNRSFKHLKSPIE